MSEQANDPINDFKSNPNVSFDKTKQKWILEDDDGNENEWDDNSKRWITISNDDQIKAQQEAYSVKGVDESTPADAIARRAEKKRKDYTSNKDANDNYNKKQKSAPKTAIFVCGLPLNTTVDEVAEVFGKWGVLLPDDEGNPKVKLYYDGNNNFKGEALVVYYKEASVQLAIQLMDNSEFRYGEGGNIRVTEAEFKADDNNSSNKSKKVRTEEEKRRKQSKFRKLDEKINDWESEDESGLADALPSVTNSRVVVLRHMFTLDELKEDPTLLLELKEDVREDAEQIGKVTNVVLYDSEPDGIMTIKFSDSLAAKACVIKYNGRFFGGRKVESYLYDGKESFKSTKTENKYDENTEEEEKQRLEGFGKWLENENQ